MFCSKKALHRLNNIHESSLNLIDQYYISNLVAVFVNANEKSIHKKCLEFPKAEICKYLNDLK